MKQRNIYDDINNLTAVEIYKLVISRRLSRFPNYFWSGSDTNQNVVECIKYLIENILDWDEKHVKTSLKTETFKKNRLGAMLAIIFGDSAYRALDTAYPDKYKPWELQNTPLNYWNLDTGIMATKWLLEKLKWTDEDILTNICINTFESNGLGGMLAVVYSGSAYRALNSVYPNKYKPWLFKNSPSNYWTLELGIEAVKWLIEDVHGWDIQNVKDNLDSNIFCENNLESMLSALFNCSPYLAINTAYPGVYKPWDFNCPRNYWNCDTGIMATKWLIEDKLQWNDDEVKQMLDIAVFRSNGLAGMLQHVFKSSPFKAINALYPGKYYPWELKKTANNYWTKENVDTVSVL